MLCTTLARERMGAVAGAIVQVMLAHSLGTESGTDQEQSEPMTVNDILKQWQRSCTEYVWLYCVYMCILYMYIECILYVCIYCVMMYECMD